MIKNLEKNSLADELDKTKKQLVASMHQSNELRNAFEEYRTEMEHKMATCLNELSKRRDAGNDLAQKNHELMYQVAQLRSENEKLQSDRDAIAKELKDCKDQSRVELEKLRLHYEQRLYILKNEGGKD